MGKDRKGWKKMRIALRSIGSEKRHVFYGTFARYGIKDGYKCPLKTVLLVDVKDENKKIITTHLWFNLTKSFKNLEMQPGDLVMFNGRVKPYMKGYRGKRTDVFAPIEMDYQIEYPTKPKIVERRNSRTSKNNKGENDGRSN